MYSGDFGFVGSGAKTFARSERYVRRSKSKLQPFPIPVCLLTALLFGGCTEPSTAPSPPEVGTQDQVSLAKATTLYDGRYFGEPTGHSHKNVAIVSNYYKFRNETLVPTNTLAYVDNAGNVSYTPTNITGKVSTGTAFECVEFVRRFMWRTYRILPPNVNGGDFWTQSVSKMGAVRRVTDGYSTVLPQSDDIVVMGNTNNGTKVSGDGHGAIVTKASSSSVTYAQQNTAAPISNKSVTTVQLAGSKRYKLGPISGTGTKGYYVKGWFTRATHPKSTPSITGFGPTAPKVSSQPVTIVLLTVGIVNLDDVIVSLTDPSGKQTPFSIVAGSIRPTPAGIVFDAKLTIAGKWTAQLSAGSGTSAKYVFSVQK